MSAQKPKLKKSFIRESVDEGVQQAQHFLADVVRRLFGLSENWQKQRDVVQNNYSLGLMHFERGNINDAVFRFRLVTLFDPRRAKGWYYLGRSYLAEGKPMMAIAAFKKSLTLDATDAEAVYMLAVAQGKKAPLESLPKHMPISLSREHFEGLAERFNEEQLQTYGYKGHVVVAEAVRAQMMPGRIDHLVLDLGVGTGLCGALLRDVSAHITGVDFSASMLAEAVKVQDGEGKKCYDALVHREIHEFLADGAPESYDIVLAADVLSYIGDLQPLMQGVAHVLKQGGIFAFTAEIFPGQDYRFSSVAGRFGYSAAYLRTLAAMAGLSEITLTEVEIYPEYKAWLCVLRK